MKKTVQVPETVYAKSVIDWLLRVMEQTLDEVFFDVAFYSSNSLQISWLTASFDIQEAYKTRSLVLRSELFIIEEEDLTLLGFKGS